MKHAFLIAIILAFGSVSFAEEIHIINCGNGDGPKDMLEAEHIADWEAETGHTVKVEFVPWGQCQGKTTQLAAAGNPVSAAYMGARVLRQLAASDRIVPITLTQAERDSYSEAVLSTVTVGGQVWGMPRAFSTKALFWNKALFDEAGVNMPDGPKTFEDVVAAAKLVHENTDAAGFGLAAADFDSTMHQFLNWMYSNGGEVINTDGDVVFNSPNNVETLGFYRDVAQYAQEGPLGYRAHELRPLFANGTIGMYIGPPWGRGTAEQVDYRLSLVPSGSMGESSTVMVLDSFTVFKGTGHENAAIDLVKYLTATEQQTPFDELGATTPIRIGAATDALIAEDPTWAPFINSIPSGGPEPLMEDYLAMQEVINQGIQGVILGEVSPEDTARDIQEGLEAIN